MKRKQDLLIDRWLVNWLWVMTEPWVIWRFFEFGVQWYDAYERWLGKEGPEEVVAFKGIISPYLRETKENHGVKSSCPWAKIRTRHLLNAKYACLPSNHKISEREKERNNDLRVELIKPHFLLYNSLDLEIYYYYYRYFSLFDFCEELTKYRLCLY
jgi:hypothetical protein